MGKLDKLKEAFGHSKDEQEVAPPPQYLPSEYPYSQQSAPGYGGSQHGGPQHGGPQYGGPQYGGFQHGQSQYGQLQYGQPQYGNSNQNPYPVAAPEYSTPRLSPQPINQRSSSGTLIIPPRLSCQYKHLRTYVGHYGTKENPLFTLTAPKLFGRAETTLHSTADKESPPLAVFGSLKGSKYLKSVIRVPARAGGDRIEDIEVTLDGDYETTHRFHLEVGRDRRTEFFEWRNSSGQEVRDIGQSRTSKGYKLIRLASRDHDRGGDRKERDRGFTSDGEEIVAVGAHTSSWTSGPNFAFVGTGLTGAFGETWEIVVVASWLRLVEIRKQQQAANGTAANAASAATS